MNVNKEWNCLKSDLCDVYTRIVNVKNHPELTNMEISIIIPKNFDRDDNLYQKIIRMEVKRTYKSFNTEYGLHLRSKLNSTEYEFLDDAEDVFKLADLLASAEEDRIHESTPRGTPIPGNPYGATIVPLGVTNNRELNNLYKK